MADAQEERFRDLDDAEMALALAHAEVVQRQEDLAEHVFGEEPRTSSTIRTAGIGLLSAGMAMSLFDGVHQHISDPYMAAMIALGPSIAAGLFLTEALYSTAAPKSRKWGILAGLGLSASVGLLRLTFSGGGLGKAIALTLFELAIVALLELRGRELRDRFEPWCAERTEHARREQRLAAAQEVEQSTLNKVTTLKDEIAAHEEMRQFRLYCSQKLEEIREGAIQAELAGARLGIGEMKGLKRGIIPEYLRRKG